MVTIDAPATGARIKEMRLDRGFSVRDLQEVYGFEAPTVIYKWQKGASMPTLDNLVVLSSIFGCRLDDIIVVREA